MENERAPDFIRDHGYLTLGSLLKRVGERMQGDVQRLLRAEGVDVPVGLLPTLGALDLHGPLTIGALASVLGIAQPGVTRNVALLAKQGLVISARPRADQRQRMVSLTARGGAILRQTQTELWPHIEGAVRQICAPLRGPILEQIAAIEASLDEAPLDQRAAALRKGDVR